MARHLIQFGSLALAGALVLIELIWAPSTRPVEPVAPAKPRVVRLSLEQCHESLVAGDWRSAEEELERLQGDLPEDSTHWNYGNVYYQFMSLSGLLALYRDDDLERAKGFLALSARTPASPQLSTFGPNMLLAKALLDVGEFEAVELYLKGCESFWPTGWQSLQTWQAQLRERQSPDFGANLYY